MFRVLPLCGVFSLVWLLAALPVAGQDRLRPGKGSFVYNRYQPLAHKPVTVWYYNPDSTARNLPVVFVIHGMGRNADGYRDAWADIAQAQGFLLLVPEFSQEHYPGPEAYNLGNMFTKDGKPVPEEKWSYSVIEPLFDYVKQITGNPAAGYTMYGHSAGSQFVHRYLFFKPDARVNKYITANAGWYTMPDFTVEFPYGLKGARLKPEHLKKALQKKVVVLLGEADTDPGHKSLRRTPEAMRQGAHRFERGQRFYAAARKKAEALGVKFGWELDTVPGAAHSNAQMAVGAAPWMAISK